ncbi:aldo/keto reductase [Haloplasma contractile]|uniref:Orotidine-5'-phosphate decarboxylase protein n=1 Tax=Haloplasma contractile SSD-17B TaxID=1033810 RepID=U2FLK3_9MOLU|nr:aldo/keto reductase [Haloplasma contractile]ERJ13625.1 orotidine-5'-phosphate decarboxylase protein [Haloplasma contractile SSD-17B]
MKYVANDKRYQNMVYNRCGNSGLKLPAISLGMWHNFGSVDSYENAKAMILKAFDLGITHFDLANNYGPEPGSAEETLGRVLKKELKGYRDEVVISTKAGYGMWEGPYGDHGSKKYLISSLNQSLNRLGLAYVDIFYHHRPDKDTPLEETIGALDQIVRQGKALYVGISNYNAEETKRASEIAKDLGTPLLIHQPSYSMFNRSVENGLLDVTEEEGMGVMAFMPLQQGLLTNKYLKEIPEDSRAAGTSVFLNRNDITEDKILKIQKLNVIAKDRNQTLAQMAIAWVLRDKRVTSALIGASRVSQIEDNVKTINNLYFSQSELDAIRTIITE